MTKGNGRPKLVPGPVVVTAFEISQQVERQGRQLIDEFHDATVGFVVNHRGALHYASDLLLQFASQAALEGHFPEFLTGHVRYGRYGPGTEGGIFRIFKELSPEELALLGRAGIIFLVDEFCDKRVTNKRAIAHLASLFRKKNRELATHIFPLNLLQRFRPDGDNAPLSYCQPIFLRPELGHVVGYGLGLDEHYRHLRDIHRLVDRSES